jgi:hypothetical protein
VICIKKKEIPMKKYLLVLFTAIFVISGYALAEMYGTDTSTGTTMTKKMAMKPYVKMMSDKMMMMQEGKWVEMQTDTTMPNGNVVSKDGNITMQDGTRKMMKNGEMLDMNGDMMKKKMKDFTMMKDGKVMEMKGGKSMEMQGDMTMPNGTVVSKDGTITMKDGTKAMMKEGEKMDMKGNMMNKDEMEKKGM